MWISSPKLLEPWGWLRLAHLVQEGSSGALRTGLRGRRAQVPLWPVLSPECCPPADRPRELDHALPAAGGESPDSGLAGAAVGPLLLHATGSLLSSRLVPGVPGCPGGKSVTDASAPANAHSIL